LAIRRLNFTKRKKLTRNEVSIRLTDRVDGEPRRFEAHLNLPAELPADALVFIEAQRASPFARMRFPWGTVGALRPPADTTLTDFPEELGLPVFRVKVTSAQGARGKLLAEAHRIRPVDPSEVPDKRRGILPISWKDNDGLVWQLDINDSSGPRLYIDKTADPYGDLPSQAHFRALVFPEVMRQVLAFIVRDEDSLDEPGTWRHAWMSLPRQTFGFTEPCPSTSDETVKDEWVNDAVKWCARKAGFCRAIAPEAGEE
jgi:hypothetical protein